MVDIGRWWRRYGTALVCVLAGAVLLWVSLHSKGSDWFYCETYADILYTGVWSFKEYPYFSWVFNGGSYFLQDPQSNLFSPTALAILLGGPSVGLRVMIAIWGGVGCYFFIAWLRRRVSETAAQLGALSWTFSLGMLWHIAVGNDMFMWHLALPGLLLLFEDVMMKRTLSSALGLGLALGVLLLGPSFHSFTYLFAPALTLFVAARFVSLRPRWVSSLTVIGLFGIALLLAVMIASPKIAWWRVLEMKRPVSDPGALSLVEGLRSLYDYSSTRWELHDSFVKDSPTPLRLLGTEETALALPPTATLLALIGLGALLRDKSKRLLALLSLCFIGLALSLACSVDIWFKVRELSGGNIRAAARFLALAGFGLSLLAALGADFLLDRWRRAAPYVGAAFGVTILAAPLWWTHEAGQVAQRAREDTVRPEIIRPLATLKEERSKALALTSFSHIVQFHRGKREVLEGRGYRDGFQIVGNRFQQKLFKTRSRKKNRQPKPIVGGSLETENVTVGHTRIQLRNLPPSGSVTLRVREPPLGLEVFPTSARDRLEIKFGKAGCVITNISSRKLRRVTLRPKFPISFGWFGLSAASLLGAGFFVTSKRKPKGPPSSAPTPNPDPLDVESGESKKNRELGEEAHVTGPRP